MSALLDKRDPRRQAAKSDTMNRTARVEVGITNLGLCIVADGDGSFDGNPTTDLFTWGFHHQMPQQPAGPEGKLFGSVTAADVVAAVLEQTDIELDRRQVDVDVIKTTGQHTVTASLHNDVSFPITIDVVAAGWSSPSTLQVDEPLGTRRTT